MTALAVLIPVTGKPAQGVKLGLLHDRVTAVTQFEEPVWP